MKLTVNGKKQQATKVQRTDGNKQTILWIVDGLPTPARKQIAVRACLIAGAILLYFGTGPVRGFATSLIIGLLASLFT